tara:strand:- start:18239 stop:19468 length:1230 start_codon:yes stop_codon:yes gene_type:complete
MNKEEFVNCVKSFNKFGTTTRLTNFKWPTATSTGITEKAFNEYWTSAQRQSHSLHEISYRACFKAQLPEFFISRLCDPGDAVYDPFMGRGTTPLEAYLHGCKPLGNDINPLSVALLAPRLNPPSLQEIITRLATIDLSAAEEKFPQLKVFFHPQTLTQIISLKEYLLRREQSGELDGVDQWIRMVAINRLTGHSPGFFSVYSLPPNQAVSIDAQAKINQTRRQSPDAKDIVPRIINRSKSLLKNWSETQFNNQNNSLSPMLAIGPADNAKGIESNSAQLVVTSPPFLDVVDYRTDNWMRCWFLGIDSSTIKISSYKNAEEWQDFIAEVFVDLYRIVRPGGYVAFEVGEVRNGKLLLEELVLPVGVEAGFQPVIIMINVQEFTKTANTWGVDNQKNGTNTNRIVVFQKGP